MIEKNLALLVDLFYDWNQKINLSAIRDKEGIQLKHIQDSLELNNIFKIKEGKNVIDLGTGGGFPLLPLAISNPKVNFVGIDARKKKIDAINDMINSLGIDNAKGIWSRGEDHQEKYDILVTRAVGYIDKLIKFGFHLVKKGGTICLYKMESEEDKDIEKLAKKYKFKIQKKHKYKLYGDDIQRIIYIIKK